MPPIIFLDIDGVLVPDGQSAPTYPMFMPRCVEALKFILAAIPAAKVVFCTTWRLPAYVNQLHAQWLEHGFPLSLALDGTPDLRDDPNVSRLHRRGIEIRTWLEMNPSAVNWVVLDDERMGIERILDNDRCVFTNPTRGLTTEDAERAVGILAGLPARKVD